MRLKKVSHTCTLKPPYLINSMTHVCCNNIVKRNIYLLTFTFSQVKKFFFPTAGQLIQIEHLKWSFLYNQLRNTSGIKFLAAYLIWDYYILFSSPQIHCSLIQQRIISDVHVSGWFLASLLWDINMWAHITAIWVIKGTQKVYH